MSKRLKIDDTPKSLTYFLEKEKNGQQLSAAEKVQMFEILQTSLQQIQEDNVQEIDSKLNVLSSHKDVVEYVQLKDELICLKHEIKLKQTGSNTCKAYLEKKETLQSLQRELGQRSKKRRK